MKTMILMLIVAGCGSSASSHTTGSFGGMCYPNNTCDVGLLCDQGLCVDGPDGGMPPGDGHHADAPDNTPDAPSCTQDMYEPNDTSLGATNLGLTKNMLTQIQNLTICPNSDQDWFVETMPTGNSTLTIDVRWTSGTALVGAVYDFQGTLVTQLVLAGTGHLHAAPTGLTSGENYTVRVWTSGTGSNPGYSLQAQVSL